MRRNEVVLVGASTRAAASAAVRAGFDPWCVDLFGDEDLRDIATVRVVPRTGYPRDLPELLAKWAPPKAPAIYTGALENYPETIARIAAQRPLWGVAAEVAAARFEFLRIIASEGAARVPRMRAVSDYEGLDSDTKWLVKPQRPGAGFSIRIHDATTPSTNEKAFGCLQEFRSGEPFSAVFIADSERMVLVGLARQWVGEPWLHARPFRFCGAMGQVDTTDFLEGLVLEKLAAAAVRFGFRGVFGMDFIRDAESWWLLEVNPRWPASAEVHELALKEPLFSWHARCFTEPTPLRAWQTPVPQRAVAKAILYVPAHTPAYARFPASILKHLTNGSGDQWSVPAVADIPANGAELAAGQPLFTLFASAAPSQLGNLHDKLHAEVAAIYQKLEDTLELDHAFAE